MRDQETNSGLIITDAEIRQRLEPILRLRTLDHGVGNELTVRENSVLVTSDEPLDDGEPKERTITFDMIRDWDKKPHRSIRRALARILGLNVAKG